MDAGASERAKSACLRQPGILPRQDAYRSLLETMTLPEQSPELPANPHKLVYGQVARSDACPGAGIETAIRTCVARRRKRGTREPLTPYLPQGGRRPTGAELLLGLMIWYACIRAGQCVCAV